MLVLFFPQGIKFPYVMLPILRQLVKPPAHHVVEECFAVPGGNQMHLPVGLDVPLAHTALDALAREHETVLVADEVCPVRALTC